MEKFARRCDVTGKGMNEGWCWGDGMFYTESKEDTLAELRKTCPEQAHLSDDELLTWAVEEEELLYWTDWYEEDFEEAGFYFTEDGEEIETGTEISEEVKELAVVTAYIQHHGLLDVGSFFYTIDKAIEIAAAFVSKYGPNYEWVEEDFEETLTKFVKDFETKI